MNRITFIGLFLLALSAPAIAQKDTDIVFRFRDMMDIVDLSSVDQSLVPANYFGEDIAVKYYLLQKTYTFVIQGSPSSPGDKTEIEKPVIYNSIKKLSRHYKKMIKKGLITKEDASTKLHHALNVGLSIKNQDTAALEAAIRAADDFSVVATLYENIVLE